MDRELKQRDESRSNGDILAKHLLRILKNYEYPPRNLYDTLADYAEKEQHSILLLKLGLIEPDNVGGELKKEAIKNLNNLKLINKPIEYENSLGKRKLKCLQNPIHVVES